VPVRTKEKMTHKLKENGKKWKKLKKKLFVKIVAKCREISWILCLEKKKTK
jgi:hypothetical protein